MYARRAVSSCAAVCFAAATWRVAANVAEEPLLVFSSAPPSAQRALESRFDAQLQADHLREWMARLAGCPHPVGSPHGRDNA